ncbi:MAG: hypothetical protein CSB44_04850 [Gammaproteobacteria bacterium]|nr:MAG: hypothetical protein CSB44_04850 [Gammaproteobacteria bacterium]
MNPYQVMGLIAIGILLFASVVMLLSYSGVPVLVAFGAVYFGAMIAMRLMQNRARCSQDGFHRARRARCARKQSESDNVVELYGRHESPVEQNRLPQAGVVGVNSSQIPM